MSYNGNDTKIGGLLFFLEKGSKDPYLSESAYHNPRFHFPLYLSFQLRVKAKADLELMSLNQSHPLS